MLEGGGGAAWRWARGRQQRGGVSSCRSTEGLRQPGLGRLAETVLD